MKSLSVHWSVSLLLLTCSVLSASDHAASSILTLEWKCPKGSDIVDLLDHLYSNESLPVLITSKCLSLGKVNCANNVFLLSSNACLVILKRIRKWKNWRFVQEKCTAEANFDLSSTPVFTYFDSKAAFADRFAPKLPKSTMKVSMNIVFERVVSKNSLA